MDLKKWSFSDAGNIRHKKNRQTDVKDSCFVLLHGQSAAQYVVDEKIMTMSPGAEQKIDPYDQVAMI